MESAVEEAGGRVIVPEQLLLPRPEAAEEGDGWLCYRKGARALVRASADTFDREGKAILEASCTKYFCTEAAGRIADRALQVHGGAGYMAEYDIERLYRDIRLLRIYEGTSQIQQLVIARRTLAQRAG